MRVSTKAIFNLISKTDNKDVKEILQKMVSNKAELLKTELPQKTELSKKTNVKKLINQLLKELSSNTKTKQNILQEIKQNDIPKLVKKYNNRIKNTFKSS